MAKRRSHGEGTVYFWEQKKLWVGRLTMPDGKRKTKYGKTQKEVSDWLLAQRRELSDGIYLPNEKITVKAFLKRYLEDYGAVSLRPTTLHSYRSLLERHVYPDIGDLKLTQLRTEHLNHLYSTKLRAGLSNRTVQYIHGVLRRALNKAVKWGLLAKNPTDLANPPSVKFKVCTTWTAEQVKTFLDSLGDDRWAGIYYLACGTGMRKGEILGLPLSALDIENGHLKVVQALQYVPGGGLIFTEPKTNKSRRMIVLPEFVVLALKAHLIRRAVLAETPHWVDSGLVFTTDIGSPITPRNLLRHFKKKLADAGLPEIRFHDLRHTVATLLLEKNTHPLIVSSLLGHSGVNLTLNLYSHVLPTMQKEAAENLDAIFK